MASKRNKLLFDIKSLLSEREKAIEDTKTLQEKYQILLKKYQPQIDEFSTEADILAIKFRKLYKESQEAYQAGAGALAKSLSVEGHKTEDQCKEFNSNANILCKKLRGLLDKIEASRKSIKEIGEKISQIRSEIRTVRQTKIIGFEKSKVIDNLKVQEFIDDFPGKIFQEIQDFCYKDIFFKDKAGITHWDKKSGKAVISIYRQPWADEESVEEFKKTICHEIGHVIFEKSMADTERWQWGLWYQESTERNNFITKEAELSRADDFCECFTEFKINPNYLDKFDQRRYDFIKDVYSRLEEEQ